MSTCVGHPFTLHVHDVSDPEALALGSQTKPTRSSTLFNQPIPS